QDRSLANDPAESRDPDSISSRQEPKRKFAPQTACVEVRGEDSPLRRSITHADTGSFDSAKGFASEPPRSAQDDNVKGVSERASDLDVFRAFFRAGRRRQYPRNLRIAPDPGQEPGARAKGQRQPPQPCSTGLASRRNRLFFPARRRARPAAYDR